LHLLPKKSIVQLKNLKIQSSVKKSRAIFIPEAQLSNSFPKDEFVMVLQMVCYSSKHPKGRRCIAEPCFAP